MRPKRVCLLGYESLKLLGWMVFLNLVAEDCETHPPNGSRPSEVREVNRRRTWFLLLFLRMSFLRFSKHVREDHCLGPIACHAMWGTTGRRDVSWNLPLRFDFSYNRHPDISVIDKVTLARSMKTHCIFLVSSMSWKITQPEDGFLVKRVELGWTCNTCLTLNRCS